MYLFNQKDNNLTQKHLLQTYLLHLITELGNSMSIETKVLDTQVYINGDGEKTIIMIHGWPDTHEIWDKQVDFFKNDFRCVTFTLPGFSKGDIKKYSLEDVIFEVDAIVNAVSPNDKVILMVHDWGCVFGYEYAMRYPDKIYKMIGIDIGDAASKEFMDSLSISAKLMVFSYQITLALGYLIKSDSIHKTMAKALKAKSNIDNIHSGMGLPYAMKWLGANGGMNNLKPINPTFPFFYAYGTKKPFMFHSKAWETKIKIQPTNEVRAFNSTHWVMVDRADEFNEAVRNWLIQ
jgi:pimeloyl-ACP methyl ester carboxylesterase